MMPATYEPFWSLIGAQYLAYDSGHPWAEWLRDDPVFFDIWGSLILALVAVYVWATIMFGCRFSNLTNRGIITNGPYRFAKHPAYIAKNLSWWLVSAPFLSDGGWQALRHTALLLMLNGVYALRAWTEERHLSHDPTYVAYASWIERNGLFRFFGSARAAVTLGSFRLMGGSAD
jgi:protein-S-isoprenylcysteine O-methyltransferase Ste14